MRTSQVFTPTISQQLIRGTLLFALFNLIPSVSLLPFPSLERMGRLKTWGNEVVQFLTLHHNSRDAHFEIQSHLIFLLFSLVYQEQGLIVIILTCYFVFSCSLINTLIDVNGKRREKKQKTKSDRRNFFTSRGKVGSQFLRQQL